MTRDGRARTLEENRSEREKSDWDTMVTTVKKQRNNLRFSSSK